MEALGSTASAFAVVSLAVQLGENVRKLYEFWQSVKEAPENIQNIASDLELLSSVLSQIAHDVQNTIPDHTLIAVLNSCITKVTTISTLITAFEPGFASRKITTRKWSAVKAAFKQEKLEKLLVTLEGMKTTLILAQHKLQSRLQSTRHDAHQQAMAVISQKIDSINFSQISQTITSTSNTANVTVDGEDHLKAIRAEIARLADQIANPVYRYGFQKAVTNAVNNSLGGSRDVNAAESASDSIPMTILPEERPCGRSGSPSRSSDYFVCITRSHSVTATTFGTISFELKESQKRIQDLDEPSESSETPQYKRQTTFVFHPAQWLIKLGFQHGLRAAFSKCSALGPNYVVAVTRPVPDDSLIFQFCEDGNLSAVRTLMSRGHASVRDVDSYGRSALWFAARFHQVEVCKFLIKSGAAKNTPLHRRPPGFQPLTYWRTPLSVASHDLLDQEVSCQDVIDTFRLFVEDVDFSDNDSDAWHFLENLIRAAEAELKYNTDSLALWAFSKFASDLRAVSHLPRFKDLFHSSVCLDRRELSLLMLNFDKNLSRTTPSWDGQLSVLHFLQYRIHNYHEEAISFLQSGADPHLICPSFYVTSYGETPTSLALYSQFAFQRWRNVLNELCVDLHCFVIKELQQRDSPLKLAGWTVETLLALFRNYNTENSVRPNPWSPCVNHGDYGLFMVEPCWLQVLERIKRQLEPLDMSEEAIRDDLSINDAHGCQNEDVLRVNGSWSPDGSEARDGTQSSNHKVDILDLRFEEDEWLCINCWEHCKALRLCPDPERETETGGSLSDHDIDISNREEDSGDDGSSYEEFSPFHVHT
ncbi:hypothetical protein MMC25_000951 [Agyrium rufum]|nr:hypothetical protein [Agyrium rufum]